MAEDRKTTFHFDSGLSVDTSKPLAEVIADLAKAAANGRPWLAYGPPDGQQILVQISRITMISGTGAELEDS